MINGRGRAPLIVVPDTGTRPQTKQDRPEAGCHAQSPSSRKPECCSGEFGGKRGHLVMTVEESPEETQVSNQLWDVRGMFEVRPYGWGGDLQETNTEDRVTETRVIDCPDMGGRDLQGLTLSSLDYPHWI